MWKRVLVGLCVCSVPYLTFAQDLRDLTKPKLHIEGAKVHSEESAKDLAFQYYAKKMRGEILANESARSVAVITLGFDLPNFAAKNDRIWEVRFVTMEHDLRAILWVNSKTEQVYSVVGPWERAPKE